MIMKKITKMIFDRRAMNNTISVTILTGAVIALSLAVFGWAQSRSSAYNSELGETVDAETARLKEKLIFEYIFYNSSKEITIYLMNCLHSIDGVKIQTVYIYDSSNTPIELFSNPPLYAFQGWDEIPGQALDRGDEGRIVLQLSTGLTKGAYYFVKVVTARGATFDSGFVV